MCSRTKNPKADRLMLIGQGGFLAGLFSLQLHRWAPVPSDLTDGIAGLFYGIAIGCLLWSIRARQSSDPSN